MEQKPTADITEKVDLFLKRKFPNAIRGEKFEGSMNDVFAFADGDKGMVLRIPKRSDTGVVSRMTAEIITLNFVRSLGLPVPEVHGYGISNLNDLGSPYMILSSVEGALYLQFFKGSNSQGKSLFDKFQDGGYTREKMYQVIDQLYTYKTILESRACFETIGTLDSVSAEDGKPILGPLICPENNLIPLPAHLILQDPFNNSWEFWTYLLQVTDYWREKGLQQIQRHGHLKSQTILSSRKRFVHIASCVAEYSSLESQFPKNILTHLDLDVQNIYVDDEWKVTGKSLFQFRLTTLGIIDWEYATAIPEYSVDAVPLMLNKEYKLEWFNRVIPSAQEEMGHWLARWAGHLPKAQGRLVDASILEQRYYFEQSVRRHELQTETDLLKFTVSKEYLKFPRLLNIQKKSADISGSSKLKSLTNQAQESKATTGSLWLL